MSPTVLRRGPYRFFFFASDQNEPHTSMRSATGRSAKFWLAPVRRAYNHGFGVVELNRIASIVTANEGDLLKA